MPFYDFRCSKCKIVYEIRETISEHTRTEIHKCPDCGGVLISIITSPPKVNFKESSKGNNLSATQRRKLWDSDKPSDFRKLM